MKTLICTKPGLLEYVEEEKPHLQKGFSLLKIKRIGIWGTDLHAYEGTQPFFEYPRILGHELSAEYIDGDAEGFKKGEAVTIIPYFNCGNCIACRTGKPNCCVGMKVCGVHQNGGMTEYLSVPSYSLVHGNGLSLEELALVEPLAIAAHGIRRANIQKNEFVLVMGAGPIGLGLMEFARIKGATVISMDLNEKRLSFCKEVLAIPYTINALNEDIFQRLKEITKGDMPTVVIDATGSLKAINNGFAYMAHGARYILVGLQKKEITVVHPEFHKREATLMSSRNATREDFEFVISSMKQKLVDPGTYITHKVAFDQVKNNFSNWIDPHYGVIKAMVTMD